MKNKFCDSKNYNRNIVVITTNIGLSKAKHKYIISKFWLGNRPGRLPVNLASGYTAMRILDVSSLDTPECQQMYARHDVIWLNVSFSRVSCLRYLCK